MEEGEYKNEKYEQMTSHPVEKLVCKLAIPSIIIMMISAMYNMADTYFVGKLGTSATAAVGVVFPLMALIQAIGFFFGQGAGNFISRALGAKDSKKACQMAATGFFSAFIMGAIIAVIGTIFIRHLSLSLGATETILPYSKEYMRFILAGMPFMTSSIVLNNLLRFQGSAFYGMIGMVSGAFLNIGLDPLFIFVFKMGVSGASLATMLSQMTSCVLLFLGCMHGENVRIYPKNFLPRWSSYKEIIRGGTPSLLRQSLNSISVICLNHAAAAYGDAVIAAISIVNRFVMFSSSALLGFGQGFQPVCGFNYGAKLYGRVKKAFWFCIKVVSAALVVLAITSFIFAPEIIAIFRKDDPEVIKVGTISLRLQCFTFPLLGWVVINNMMLQTTGKAVSASIMAFARQGLFLIPFIFILTPLLGVFGIQLCSPISDFCTFLLSIPISIYALRGMKDNKKL